MIDRKYFFCKTLIEVTHDSGEGDDFVMINQRSCQCLSCPKCILENSINQKTKPLVCPVDREVVNGIKYFFSSRVKHGQCHVISVEQFKIDIDKEPVQVF